MIYYISIHFEGSHIKLKKMTAVFHVRCLKKYIRLFVVECSFEMNSGKINVNKRENEIKRKKRLFHISWCIFNCLFNSRIPLIDLRGWREKLSTYNCNVNVSRSLDIITVSF